jgi:hypothetical protein
MMRPAVRLTLLVIFLATLGVTAYLFWMAEHDAERTDAAVRALNDAIRATVLDITELRSAQQAYVAEGQGADFWFTRTHTLQNELKGRVTALRSQASSSAAVSSFEDALGILQDFEQMDVRAREHVRARRFLAASDLIFSDGVDLTRKLSSTVEQGRQAQIAALDFNLAALRRRETFSLGAAAATALLIVLLLVPVRDRVVERAVPLTSPSLSLRSVDSFVDQNEWTPANPVPAAAARVERTLETPVKPVASTVSEPPKVDFQNVARLCTDLVRVTDTRALPGMLERAATLIDASGIVLWIADPDGRELAPIVTHGYSPHTVTRLGTIPREAENATAAAFRTCLLQTVDTDAVSNGAIAAPLVTSGGCVGVMAAEVRNQGERHDTVRATASIVAAQLATLVGPPASRAIKADVG